MTFLSCVLTSSGEKMNMMKLVATAMLCAASVPAMAAVEFVPPSDTVGQVWSTNGNDGYSTSRGVVFVATSNFNLTSVGLYHDITNVSLSYTLSTAPSTSGFVGGGTLLRSGTQIATTTGLEFVDFNVAPLTLQAGSAYYLAFGHFGAANQNFFYDQSGAEPYAQAGFSNIDGTQANHTGNFVIARIRLNGSAGVPEPAAWAMMLAGFGLVGGAMRAPRRSAATAA